ncbi:hypothetical protein C8R43DRAFT_1000870 [Mycena crocata]|nr:hypothetical protein C8R43DRAFT_1000870 [Mycena crocata]
MPAPVAVYVLAAVGTIAASLAFKEFVYEPHIAPRVERWAEEFLEKRRMKKAQRAQRNAVAVPSTTGDAAGDADIKSTYELESLVANEVRQWRTQVDVSRGEGSGLRHRKNVGSSTTGSALDESNIIIPYSPLMPTHVLFDPTDGLTVASSPTSTISSRVHTPSPHSTLSHSTFRTPPPAAQAPPTPEPSVRGSPTPAASTPARAPSPTLDPFLFTASSPHHVPSLSLSHPLDLDSEHDLELLSAASSSRPSSPFSEFSQPTTGDEQFHSFTLSPELATLSASETGSELGEEVERWSNAGSEISESSWASAGVRSR